MIDNIWHYSQFCLHQSALLHNSVYVQAIDFKEVFSENLSCIAMMNYRIKFIYNPVFPCKVTLDTDMDILSGVFYLIKLSSFSCKIGIVTLLLLLWRFCRNSGTSFFGCKYTHIGGKRTFGAFALPFLGFSRV